jgi:transposase
MKKNPTAVAQFRQTFAECLEAVVPAKSSRPVLVWAYDESRFGLQTVRRRRLTARGTKPIGTCQQRFANFYLYGAIAPTTGQGFFVGLPKLKAEYVQLFLDELARAHPDTLNVLLLDNSRCHTARALCIPDNIVLVFQPPYAPEVNPAERVWQDLKTNLAWQRFATLQDLQAEIVRLVKAYEDLTLQSLTSYPYFVDAVNALCP